MSIAPVLSIVRHRFFDAVDEQASRLERATRRRLVVGCQERQQSGWARRLSDAIFLPSAGPETEDPDLLEAMRYAIDAFGVEEIVFVAHTECAHREREERPSRVAAGGAGIFRLHDRIANHRQDLDRAKDEVRTSTARFRWAVGDEVDLVCAVEIGSSGQLLGYHEAEDEFRAIV